MEGVSAANKAVVEEGKAKPAAEEISEIKPATVGKKRTKMMRVKQAYINSLLKEYPFRPLPCEELEKSTSPLGEVFSKHLAPVIAVIKAIQDKDEAIIKQYLAQGYAKEEVEVEDDEEEVSEIKPAAVGKKRTKTMRVEQGYIDSLLKKYHFPSFPWECEALEKDMPDDPMLRAKLLTLIAPNAAMPKAARDKDEAIVKQYLAQGYAEEEVEDEDDEEDI